MAGKVTYLIALTAILFLIACIFFHGKVEQWEPVVQTVREPCLDPTRGCSLDKCWYTHRNEHGLYRIYVEKM